MPPALGLGVHMHTHAHTHAHTHTHNTHILMCAYPHERDFKKPGAQCSWRAPNLKIVFIFAFIILA